ncbi:toxin-antitoxin system TumE family protein [Paenibacillus tundrae]
MKYTDNQTNLLPADINEILEEFGFLFENHINFRDKTSIYASYKHDRKSLIVIFPLKMHPCHGITGLRAYERYDECGYVEKYEYRWMRIVPKQGIQSHHITSWGNEPHDDPNTPEKYRVKSEPHHHHYDPNDRKNRCDNWDVRCLRDAFEFIQPYLETGDEYKGRLG